MGAVRTSATRQLATDQVHLKHE